MRYCDHLIKPGVMQKKQRFSQKSVLEGNTLAIVKKKTPDIKLS